MLTGADAVSLVINTNLAARADLIVEGFPSRQVWIVPILCERFELVEAAPVLHHGECTSAQRYPSP